MIYQGNSLRHTTRSVFVEARSNRCILGASLRCIRRTLARPRLASSGLALPSSPLAPCGTPGCPNLVPRGRCKKHGRAHERETRGGNRRERWGGLYDSRWDKASASFRAAFPLCGMRPSGRKPVMSRCHAEGRSTPTYQTDHVVPHKGDRGLFWDKENNWQALCESCGNAKSRAGL